MENRHKPIHHWTLEIFGIGCGIHEVEAIYPDMRQILSHIPGFELSFAIAMKILFALTVLSWLFVGVLRVWRHFFPLPVSQVPSSLKPHISKPVGMNSSPQLAQFFQDVRMRVYDVEAAAERYLNQVDVLRRLQEHDEREAEQRYLTKPERVTPAQFRQEHENVEREEKWSSDALTDLQTFLAS